MAEAADYFFVINAEPFVDEPDWAVQRIFEWSMFRRSADRQTLVSLREVYDHAEADGLDQVSRTAFSAAWNEFHDTVGRLAAAHHNVVIVRYFPPGMGDDLPRNEVRLRGVNVGGDVVYLWRGRIDP